MIDSQNMGETTFAWWIAKVVNVNDPHQSGRVQIRVFGRHDDTTNISDDSLPWALPIQPVSSAAAGRIGTAPVGLIKGSLVAGFWADSDFQYPVIWGTIGKSGDPVDGQTEGGAPKINTDVGSIPPAVTGIVNNYRSQLNSSVTPITEIDSVGANTSISNKTGVVITKEVENGMKNAKTPTIANQPAGRDIISMLLSVDPTGKNASLPCINLSFFTLNGILGMLAGIAKSIVGALKDALIKALISIILQMAKKYGVFKVFAMINQAANEIAEVGQLVNALNIKICGVNLFNQGIFDAVNGVIAEVIHVLHIITGSVNALIGFTSNLITVATGDIFNNIVAEPIATVIANNSVPTNLVDPSNVPGNYVQNYVTSKNDTNPGYIEYVDPSGQGKSVFVPRNGQPNYTSVQQHVQFDIQHAILPQIENAVISGVLTGSGLQSLFTGAMSVARAAGALRTLGSLAGKAIGLGIGAATGITAVALTSVSLAADLTTIWTPAMASSVTNALPYVSINPTAVLTPTCGAKNDFAMAKYAIAMVSMQRKTVAMNIGLGGVLPYKGII